MSFTVTFKHETKTYEKPVSVLEVIGDNREYLCAYVNNRVRELTYLISKDSEVTPLTVKDRDAKPTYEASLRFLVAMAMRNIHPEIDIRFSYNVSRSIFMQILNPGVTSTNQMVKELIAEMNRIIERDMPLVRSIVSKEETALKK